MAVDQEGLVCLCSMRLITRICIGFVVSAWRYMKGAFGLGKARIRFDSEIIPKKESLDIFMLLALSVTSGRKKGRALRGPSGPLQVRLDGRSRLDGWINGPQG